MKRLLLLLCTSASIAVSLPEGHSDTVDVLYRAAHDSTMAYDRLKVLCETNARKAVTVAVSKPGGVSAMRGRRPQYLKKSHCTL